MADTVTDSEGQSVKPPPKRRRILDPSAFVSVPVYSNKVNSSLKIKPAAALLFEKEKTSDGADESLWPVFPTREKMTPSHSLSDLEDEAEYVSDTPDPTEKILEPTCCPSPPPPESPVQKQSRKVKSKISDIDRRLQAVSSLLLSTPEGRRSRLRQGPAQEGRQDDDDDDLIILSPTPQTSSCSSEVREIPLKVRCRTDVHKIPVLSSTPLTDVVKQMSVITNVPPTRLLLLREDVELPTEMTISELGLCITDIIECVVMAAEDKNEADSGSIITVRLRSKDVDSAQEFSLHREAPLGSIFSQYLSKMSAAAQRKVCFHFDGSKLTGCQTPAQLDMEDGDIIEVWL